MAAAAAATTVCVHVCIYVGYEYEQVCVCECVCVRGGMILQGYLYIDRRHKEGGGKTTAARARCVKIIDRWLVPVVI